MSGDIGACHDWGRDATGIYSVGVRNAEYLPLQRIASYVKNDLA